MSSDVSSVTNHFVTANEGFNTTTSSQTNSGANTVALNSVSGLTNGSVFVGVIEPGATKEQVFTGIVDTSGSQITGVVWTKGTNVDHATGVSVVDYDTGTAFNMMRKGLLVSFDQDGTLKAGAVDNAAVLASGVVTTAKIADDAVTAAKLDGIDKSLLTTDSNPYKFHAYVSSPYSGYPNNAFTKITLATEFFDTNNNFDSTTNYRYTVPISGFYQISANIGYTLLANTHALCSLFKNGGEVIRGAEGPTSNTTAAGNFPLSAFIQLTAGDYLELWGYQNQGSTSTINGSGQTFLAGYLVCRT
jgi:hypothetical protein